MKPTLENYLRLSYDRNSVPDRWDPELQFELPQGIVDKDDLSDEQINEMLDRIREGKL